MAGAVAAVAVAGMAAAIKMRGPAPGAEPPDPFAAKAEGTGTALPAPGAAVPLPPSPAALEPGAAAPPEAQVGRAAPDGPTPEPASCEIYSLGDVPSAPPLPSVSAQWYEGASGFRRAGEEQASSGAPLLLFFYVNWCPHCRRFIGEVLPSPEMRDLGERIIKVKVDSEASNEDGQLARQYSVRSFPTLLLIAGPGQPPVHLAHGGTPRAFVESCERALPDPARARLEEGISLSRSGRAEQAATALKAAAGSPKLAAVALDHLGLLALGAGCFSRAVAIYGRILDLDPTYAGGRGHHLRALAHFRSGDGARALEDAERACRLGHAQGCVAADRIRSSPGNSGRAAR